ncbi:MAG: 2-C-methyl-D-erythritol 2,4-cyclodiphosphate synthase [Phoenicibacter congonensis]|uniref:2-C-methyl-D-erythritol 2,4-cyclodiphosphate synthase n=1 Tax=Phoenicibacter congonensis TaxID=1944646 RepID=A0AA43U909_9ACTN|nr:2-C-methyl-D-erythritol 2,4-cyclodiphosphate synthase [Phoenicibacter congonensis]
MSELSIGNGFDVHALVPDRKLIIGGVEIPHETGLLGHSDADVLVHAIMDALLGAARIGDIGDLFPDTSADWKDADSIEMLKIVGARLKDEGFEIQDIDSVIMAQAPKMAPHKDAMRKNIADALGLPINKVGLKATTTEKLGFVGRKEGIAASAVCLLRKN